MNSTNRYAAMSQDDFDTTLRQLAQSDGTDALLDISGVWERASEHYYNAVLQAWKDQNPLAFDDDAPQVGDLVFNPHSTGVALQSPWGTIETVNHREGISTYNVTVYNYDVSVEFYDSAWHLTDDCATEYADDEEQGDET